MARPFTPPPIATKDRIGAIDMVYAFQLKAEFDPARRSGDRIFQGLTGGTLTGPGLTGTVYPDSGSDYGTIGSDGTRDLSARFMVRDAAGEWLYFAHTGYARPDGYYRLQATFDADVGGPYAWLNDAVMIGSGQPSPDGRQVTITYYQAR